MRKKQRSLSFLLISTILVIILNAINFGPIISQIAPIWILMVYSFYLLNYNVKYEFFIALVLGFIIDITNGDLLGQNALALVIASYFIIYNKKSMVISNITTIQVFIFIASIIYLAVILIIHFIVKGFSIYYYVLLSPFSTAIIYPIINILFKNVTNRK